MNQQDGAHSSDEQNPQESRCQESGDKAAHQYAQKGEPSASSRPKERAGSSENQQPENTSEQAEPDPLQELPPALSSKVLPAALRMLSPPGKLGESIKLRIRRNRSPHPHQRFRFPANSIRLTPLGSSLPERLEGDVGPPHEQESLHPCRSIRGLHRFLGSRKKRRPRRTDHQGRLEQQLHHHPRTRYSEVQRPEKTQERLLEEGGRTC